MNNADLALEFLKKSQECHKNGVPREMAMLAALQDLADYKDRQHQEQMEKDSMTAYVNTYENIGGTSYVEFVVDESPSKYRETEKVKIVVIKDRLKELSDRYAQAGNCDSDGVYNTAKTVLSMISLDLGKE